MTTGISLVRRTLLSERTVLLQARLTATLVDLKRLFVIGSFANRPAPQLPNPARIQTATDRSPSNTTLVTRTFVTF